MNKTLLKIKRKYWGDKLTEGLPPVFVQMIQIITDMAPDEEPPYQKLIDLLTIKKTMLCGYIKTKFTKKEVLLITWNNHINKETGQFYNKSVSVLKSRLKAFQFPTDDQMSKQHFSLTIKCDMMVFKQTHSRNELG